MNSEKLQKGEVNKITRCLDKMTKVDTYAERYTILREFSLRSYRAGASQALDEMGAQLKELFES